MNITALNSIKSEFLQDYARETNLVIPEQQDSFSSVFSAMMNSVNETNQLQNTADQMGIQFALGESTNTHDLLIAETKAAVALQYTVAVRDRLMDSYREIMQMQI